MNYPIWELPASGLLIAVVAVVHVFVAHFAVGGGLFLVLTERKARREGDAALLAFVRTHSRFFALLTLVFGAITGVGIWFTIGLVHPSATSALINTFVWAWAIEWTFFFVEIAAAMVYFYGWDRLTPATHMTVGWIYFWAAWLSLAVINGVLSFMLTPGLWLTTGGFWDGVLNPGYLPSVVARTCGAVGLAGVYALLTASRSGDPVLREKVARYAVLRWIAPMAVLLPASVVWSLHAASAAGVPVREIFGSATGGWLSIVTGIVGGSATGQPIAQLAARVLLAACAGGLVLCGIVLARGRAYGPWLASTVMLSAFLALGAAEWVREDLRKPFVIGNYMFVNSVRLADLRTIDSDGVLKTALWTRLPGDLDARPAETAMPEKGREVFRLECSTCHTIDGHLAIRPLVQGVAPGALDAMLGRLAAPAADQVWEDTQLRLRTWRGRRMPPFAGTRDERRALAVYLAGLGGAPPEAAARYGAEGDVGERFFNENCSMCHGADGDFTFDAKGRSADTLYEMIGRLPRINDAMPPLEASGAERRALAEHLATLHGTARKGGSE